MFSEHSRRRTGATDFVAPWVATKNLRVLRASATFTLIPEAVIREPGSGIFIALPGGF
jgi:hypothetical protein